MLAFGEERAVRGQKQKRRAARGGEKESFGFEWRTVAAEIFQLSMADFISFVAHNSSMSS